VHDCAVRLAGENLPTPGADVNSFLALATGPYGNAPRRHWHWRWPCLLFALASAGSAAATGATSARLFEIRIETFMPNLEENLRYTGTQETRCIGQNDLPKLFPMLSHVSLNSCRLQNEQRYGETVSYELLCAEGVETTGDAQFAIAPEKISGMLRVRMGGKNMTFTQRLSGRALGDCTNGRK
jgi:Protein of unknown function (DUF3617)